MSTAMLCMKCAPADLRNLGIDAPAPVPTHCYGEGDTPGTKGLIGSGNYCPCECRRWPHQPHALYRLAVEESDGDDEATSARYRELMIEHGHLIPGTPRNLPCGWPGSTRGEFQ
jgi:hypothetical protein